MNSENNKRISIKLIIKIVALLLVVGLIIFSLYFFVRVFPDGYFEYRGKKYNRYMPWDMDEYNSYREEKYLKEEFILNGGAFVFKPIIYIYPEEISELKIRLNKKENITCSYPKYLDGWEVIAYPDGTLIEKNTNKKLYALYWEGKRTEDISSLNEGFVIKSEDVSKFLEEKLSLLGLNERESEEFIIYWLPKLEKNKYNLIRFETMDEIEKEMKLTISKEPDTLIRVWMQFKGLEEYIDVPEQILESAERKGFTVVEWGGTEIK